MKFSKMLLIISLIFSIPGINFANAAGSSNGSISLDGSNWLTIESGTNWQIGSSQDFSVEWWQYNNSLTPFPRIFSVGSYSSGDNSFAVSEEGGTLYFWMNSGVEASVGIDPIEGSDDRTWNHYSINRISNVLKIYKNGS